jgi:hypothetical protein
MKATPRDDMTYPPSSKVNWIAKRASIGLQTKGHIPLVCEVFAKTWFDARALAMREMACEPWELEVLLCER